MATLLYNDQATDSRLSTSEWVGRLHLPARHYQQDGHFLLVDGPDEDVDEILRIPGFRLATAQEQNDFAALQKKAGKLTETAEPPPPTPKQAQAKPAEPAAPAEVKE